MIEFQQVASPALGSCFCGSQVGPLVDTHYQPHGDRIYICQLCLKRAAIVMGLAEGAEMERLMRAAERVERAFAVVDQANERVTGLEAQLASKDRTIAVLEGKVVEAEGEAEQAYHALQSAKDAIKGSEPVKVVS